MTASESISGFCAHTSQGPKYCEKESTAKRLADNPSEIWKVSGIRIDQDCYINVLMIQPSEDDMKAEAQIDAEKKAVEKMQAATAKAAQLGLSDDEINLIVKDRMSKMSPIARIFGDVFEGISEAE